MGRGAARLALTGLLERGLTDLPLHLPDVEGYDDRTETLHIRVCGQLQALCEAFKARNGNPFAREYVDRTYAV